MLHVYPVTASDICQFQFMFGARRIEVFRVFERQLLVIALVLEIFRVLQVLKIFQFQLRFSNYCLVLQFASGHLEMNSLTVTFQPLVALFRYVAFDRVC